MDDNCEDFQSQDEIKTFKLIKKKFYSFKEKLIEEIKNNEFCYNQNNECYLILDTRIDELNNSIEEYDNNPNLYNRRNFDGSYIFLPNNKPEFINSITDAIDCIKKHKNFEIIKQDILNLRYSDNYLSNFNTINYFCGNNRLIIEFDGYYYNSLLLLSNPEKSFFTQNPFF